MTRILLVEDDDDAAARLELVLSAADRRVVRVGTGRNAIESVRVRVPDLVVLDMGLPDLDGLAVLGELRRDHDVAALPVLVLTARSGPEDIRAALEAGANDFVVKGRPDEELTGRIASLERVGGLHRRVVEANQRFQEELALAHLVQRRLLAPGARSLGGAEVVTCYRPSESLSGDYCDVVGLPGGRGVVFLADVVGHGTAAALFTGLLKTWFREAVAGSAGAGPRPGELLAALNLPMVETFGESGRFATAVAAAWDPEDRTLRIASAGHPAPLVQSGEGLPAPCPVLGYPLGVVPGAEFAAAEIRLDPGDRVLFFTDGAVERRGPEGLVPGGHARLVEAVAELRDRPLEEAVTVLADRLSCGSDLGRQEDDVTLVGFEAR